EPKAGLKKEIIDALVERGKKSGYLTYEEVVEVSHRYHLAENETNELLKVFEQEHIDLIMQEEAEGVAEGMEEFAATAVPTDAIKGNLDDSFDFDEEEEAEN